MFRNSRPVPSSAGLRILYQLAYISSGTAVGVAALCAEERRRRTCFVQKIADNANRLRQSPRHVYNVAAHNARHAKLRKKQKSKELGADNDPVAGREVEKRPVRGSELPSAVEKGFAQVTKSGKRAKRRRPNGEKSDKTGRDPNSASRTSEPAARGKPNLPVSGERVESSDHRQGTRKRAGPRVPGGEKSDKSRRDANSASRTSEPAARYKPSLAVSRERVESTDHRMGTLASGAQSDHQWLVPRPKSERRLRFPPMFRSKEAAALAQSADADENPRTTHVVQDVELFFRSIPWSSTGLQIEGQVASRLLREAVQHGYLPPIRNLISWKLAYDKLAEEDVALLVDTYSSPDADWNDLIGVCELFAELFASKAFARFPEDWKLSIVLSMAVKSTVWHDPRADYEFIRRLIQPTLQHSTPERIDNAVTKVCDEFLAADRVEHAFDTVSIVRIYVATLKTSELPGATPTNDRLTWASFDNRHWKGIYEKIMEHSMRVGNLWVCQRYIKHLLQAGDGPSRVPLLEWLLRESRSRKTYTPLRGILPQLMQSKDWEKLRDEAKVDLAVALTILHKGDTQFLERVCREIPKALIGPVLEAWSTNRMQYIWESQQNLSAILEEYERAKAFQVEKFGTTELKLVEICNKANRPDEALKLLSTTLQHDSQNFDPQSMLSLCMAAVALAKKSAWEQLHGFMAILAKSGRFFNNESTSRTLNDVIRIYSRRHPAAETWKFVTHMIESVGFTPNRATTNIMLLSFVNKQAPNLVSPWIRYLQRMGHHFEMSSRAATMLLSCFYYDQRPPHALLMWFCRNVGSRWPSFDASGLRDLIKNSIAYDLTKMDVQDKTLRENAAHNLARIAEPSSMIPAPYRPVVRTFAKTQEFVTETVTENPIEEAVGTTAQYNYQPSVSPQLQEAGSQQSGETMQPVRQSAVSPGGALTSSDVSQNRFLDSASPSFTYFAHLRKMYNTADDALEDDEPAAEMPVNPKEVSNDDDGRRRTVREMLLALSLRNYQQVLDVYNATLSQTGLPMSLLGLELAIEASLRLCKGDASEATRMLEAARQAGMDVRSAIGPLLINRVHNFHSGDKKNAGLLRTMVIDYYRTNEENGFPVQHHFGITTANVLINNHRPGDGINILNAIHQSDWASDRPLDIVAMTVYLKGYAKLRSQNGASWVLREVLGKNIAIDRRFLSELKYACRDFRIKSAAKRSLGLMRSNRISFAERLNLLRLKCIERRHQQRFRTKVLGNHLVEQILSCVERGTLHIDSRAELEEFFFGQPGKRESEDLFENGGNEDFESGAMSTPPDVPSISHELPKKLSRPEVWRIARAIGFQGESRMGRKRTAYETNDIRWLNQYKAFLELDMVMDDGRLASFRRRYRRYREC